ncbi:MAG: twin-arginine translocation signal domain-containing protein [Dehalococcoidia bacterium]|uniref:ABC transporter substrate-binding protein n=1 Tax=Candidatus Amarobacter glycogenicus TaxID=3140699 RepID=UPI003134DAAA|nr:twin-arginine translocation signal domain-containing protein [Dehalococcoidia bacterium]
MKDDMSIIRGKRTPSRRDFIRGASVAGIGAAAAGLVGCGDDDDAENGGDGSASPTTAATQAPKQGGVLRGAQTADLNMSTGYPFVALAENPFINALPIEPVIQYTDSLTPTLNLAERFEFNADRSSLVVKLKPGLTFHNGAPVTADDFVFGINLIQKPADFGIKAPSSSPRLPMRSKNRRC